MYAYIRMYVLHIYMYVQLSRDAIIYPCPYRNMDALCGYVYMRYVVMCIYAHFMYYVASYTYAYKPRIHTYV